MIRRCLAGDERAAEVLIDRYQQPVFNLVYRMTHRYEDAQDLTQRVFIKVFGNLKRYNPRYKFFSWMYRIALNESINFLHQQKPVEELSEQLVAANGQPDQIYEQTERSERLNLALSMLQPDYRQLIILKHLQGFSYQEIAEIIRVPEKTIKSRLFTARQLLKDALIKLGHYTDD